MNCPATNTECQKACKTACEIKMMGTEMTFGGFDNNGQPLRIPDPRIAEQLAALRADLANAKEQIAWYEARRQASLNARD